MTHSFLSPRARGEGGPSKPILDGPIKLLGYLIFSAQLCIPIQIILEQFQKIGTGMVKLYLVCMP